MTKNLDNEGLSSIADNYQLFYVDLWGVVHNGVTLHLEAIKALKEINKKKKIITNFFIIYLFFALLQKH